MEYINGFINLNNEQKTQDPNPKTHKYGMNKSYWFKINNQEYFYKECLDLQETYMELFSSIIARSINIKTVSYDLAKYKNNFGVISLNYNHNHCYEKTILELTRNFYNSVIANHYNFSFYDMYNLEMIWDSLIYTYKNQEIVLKIMHDIVDSFILQILTGNFDLNVSNLVIIEENLPFLAPNHDYSMNECLFDNNKLSYCLEVEPKSSQNIIDNFLDSSSIEFINYFKEKITMMPKIEYIFLRTELKTKKRITNELKIKYQKWYENNLQNLSEKINLRLSMAKK